MSDSCAAHGNPVDLRAVPRRCNALARVQPPGNSTCDVHPDRIAHRWRLDPEEFVGVYVTSWTRRTKLLEHLHDLFLGDLKHSNPCL
jgi:hypothetical protein